MRSRTSVSESRLGEWQTFQKMGAAQARPALRAHHGAWLGSEENFGCRQPFLGKWPPRRHTALRRTAELAA